MITKFLKEKMSPLLAFILTGLMALLYLVYSIAADVSSECIVPLYLGGTIVFIGLTVLIALGLVKGDKAITLGGIFAMIGYFNLVQLGNALDCIENLRVYIEHESNAGYVLYTLFACIFALCIFISGVLFILGKVLKHAPKQVFAVIILVCLGVATLASIGAAITILAAPVFKEIWYEAFASFTYAIYPLFFLCASSLTETLNPSEAK